MKLVLRALVFAITGTWISIVAAEPVRWTTYTIPETGTTVDFYLPRSSPTSRTAPPTATDGDFEPPTVRPSSPYRQ